MGPGEPKINQQIRTRIYVIQTVSINRPQTNPILVQNLSLIIQGAAGKEAIVRAQKIT